MFAAVEVSKLDRGSLKYICDLLGCSNNTGYLLKGYKLVQQLIIKTVTEPRLKAKADIIDKVDETEIKVSRTAKNMKVIFDKYLP